MRLFLENDKIDLTIYPEEEFDNNLVIGGTLNKEYRKYRNNIDLKFKKRLQPIKDSIDLLFEKDQFNSDKMKGILSKLKNTESAQKIVLYKEIELLEELGLDNELPRRRAYEVSKQT